MQLFTAFTENEEIYLFLDLCYKPGTAKKRGGGAKGSEGSSVQADPDYLPI